MVHIFNPSIWEAETSEFEASLVYIVYIASTRPTKATW